MISPLPTLLIEELRRHYYIVLSGPQPDCDVDTTPLLRKFGMYIVECNFDLGTVIVRNWTQLHVEWQCEH